MVVIVQEPTIVSKAMDEFIGKHFSNQPQRDHAANILSGLIMSHKKTLKAIARIIPYASDQSCMNRFINEVDWDQFALNISRIMAMQNDEAMKFHLYGIIAIDDTLIARCGPFIKNTGVLYDHSKQCNILGQDWVFIHYLNPISKKHYPLEFRCFKKQEQCDCTGEIFSKITELAIELVDFCYENHIPGTFVFDSYYTTVEIMNYIHELPSENKKEVHRHYVGDLKFNRHIIYRQKEMSVAEFAKTITGDKRKKILTSDGTLQWSADVCVWLPNVNHKVRLVFLWEHKNDEEPRKVLVSNCISWDALRITEAYRNRWTATETFHRDGKQELGLGDCQIRSEIGQIRHMYLVMLAYTLLERELDKTSVSEWAHEKLTTIGECCRAAAKEATRNMITWVIDQLDCTGKLLKRLPRLFARLGIT